MARRGQIKWGRPMRGRSIGRSRGRSRYARDPGGGTYTSDDVWNLVEKMLEGDASAVEVLHDVIAEGRVRGKTKFMLLHSKVRNRGGSKYGGELVRDRFVAVTPGSQIVIFGVAEVHGPDKEYVLSGWGRPHLRPNRIPTENEHKYPKMAENMRNMSYRGYISRFKMGDLAEYGGYNLTYFGKISGITVKRISVGDDDRRGRNKSLDLEHFAQMNWNPGNLEAGLRRNRNWSD